MSTLPSNDRSSREELRRLYFINALFSHITAHDLYLAHQIKSAIAFSLAELEEQTTSHPESVAKYDAAFAAAAAHLLEKLFIQEGRQGFYHWDAARTLTSATPLFARAEIMAGLKHLAPFRESTLLVTNLRPALLPAERRSSPRREKEYEDILRFIRDLAAARTSPSAQLHLLFL